MGVVLRGVACAVWHDRTLWLTAGATPRRAGVCVILPFLLAPPLLAHGVERGAGCHGTAVEKSPPTFLSQRCRLQL